ncbi:hypothetical protein CN172_10885 [Sinorhizobium meliloti]|uniref:hypothetical protein n=1 Tax=Rhizobium meliloti TaxID=382 RepID=UPI000FD99719|nr:hypothetical protein [Sinorhizobium meliloti]RVG00665.1 hypothetical protein CN232_12465 [Sinorhizobium meliloti]RVH46794.1 hypothetical protein CN208_06030 [Sinorhizobium meliloti]RVK16900.1 hypothetical protein CN172_10885 [Sinorhizobium meliloti]
MKIFWSWQADLEPKNNQYLVRDALRDACDQIAMADEVYEADRVELDHDTAGLSGTPDIVSGILKKIEEAAVFVADMTPVGRTNPVELRSEGASAKLPASKHLQNPNVMSELGYADHAIGQSRIILVANSAFYPGPEALPFDWRHRRGPITFNLPHSATNGDRRRVRQELSRTLQGVLVPMLNALSQRTSGGTRTARPVNAVDPAFWETKQDELEFNERGINNRKMKAVLPDGPRLYVRIRCEDWSPKSRVELAELIDRKEVRLWIQGNGGTTGVNADGGIQLAGIRSRSQDSYEAGTVTQWFSDDGELWAVDTTTFAEHEGIVYFGTQVPFAHIARYLNAALQTLATIVPGSSIEIELGVAKLLGTVLPGRSISTNFEALSDRVIVKRKFREWTFKRRNELLLEFWNQLLDAYGLRPAANLEEFEHAVLIKLDRDS